MMKTTKWARVSEWMAVDGFQVHRYSICATNCVVYSVYESIGGSYFSVTHSTTMTGPNDERFGTVMSRRLPAHIDAMPRGDGRIAACESFRKEKAELCFSLIARAYPGLRGTRDEFMGEVEEEVVS
jgi:hypothetical protein